MQSRFGTYPHDHTDTIVCPECGNCGVINWDYVPTANGRVKDFAGLSGDFYERLSNRPPYTIEVVCNFCRGAVACEPIQLQV